MPLAGVFCFTGNCSPLVFSLTGKLSFALAGAITVVVLAALSLLARKSRLAQLLAFLLALFSATICIHLINFSVHIIGSLCVLCLVSDILFFLTLIALGAALTIQAFCRKTEQNSSQIPLQRQQPR